MQQCKRCKREVNQVQNFIYLYRHMLASIVFHCMFQNTLWTDSNLISYFSLFLLFITWKTVQVVFHRSSASILDMSYFQWVFPGGASGKEPACQCRRCKRGGFNPWVGKISWRKGSPSNFLA